LFAFYASAKRIRAFAPVRPRCNASIKWQANSIAAWCRQQLWRRKSVHHFREKKVRASVRETEMPCRRDCNFASLINYVAAVIMRYIRSPDRRIMRGMANQPLAIPSILGRRSMTARAVFGSFFLLHPHRTVRSQLVGTASENSVQGADPEPQILEEKPREIAVALTTRYLSIIMDLFNVEN